MHLVELINCNPDVIMLLIMHRINALHSYVITSTEMSLNIETFIFGKCLYQYHVAIGTTENMHNIFILITCMHTAPFTLEHILV